MDFSVICNVDSEFTPGAHHFWTQSKIREYAALSIAINEHQVAEIIEWYGYELWGKYYCVHDATWKEAYGISASAADRYTITRIGTGFHLWLNIDSPAVVRERESRKILYEQILELQQQGCECMYIEQYTCPVHPLQDLVLRAKIRRINIIPGPRDVDSPTVVAPPGAERVES